MTYCSFRVVNTLEGYGRIATRRNIPCGSLWEEAIYEQRCLWNPIILLTLISNEAAAVLGETSTIVLLSSLLKCSLQVTLLMSAM